MAMGQFTKEEAKEVKETVNEIFRALSKPKQRAYLSHFNEVFLFIEAAEKVAPTEKEAEEAKTQAARSKIR